MSAARIEPLGDRALLIHVGGCIDLENNARAIALATALLDAKLPGVCDVAPAYASVCVHYEPCAWTQPDDAPFARIAARVHQIAATVGAAAAQTASAVHDIPVCYGGEFGPDLHALAQHAGLDPDTVIARHCAGEYRVAMLGFAPGFPYLLGLDATLQAPRRATPRTHVPAGSVAIGGAQTGIYPCELPGGWHIIGRTPLELFDAARSPPALLGAGQRVRFRAIDAATFVATAT